MSKKTFSVLIMFLLFVGLSTNVFATDIYTATSTINGVTVNWQYELNEENQIKNLNCTNPTDLTGNIAIPSTIDGKTVISLKYTSFKGATNLTGITIPDSVKEIGYNAFEKCDNLSSVNLGQIEDISFDVFKDCPQLTTITLPKTLKNGADNGIFTGTTKLTSVTFENGTTIIARGILKGCKGITKVTIPDTVTTIRAYAFSNSGLTEITLPNSVKEIDYYAFENCTDLTKVTILDNCTSIGWFSSYPNKDTVFNNRNDNLTIYCYENSKIADYAIANHIKYVYLPKQEQQPSETPNTNQKPTTTDSNANKEEPKKTSGTPNTNPKTTTTNDTTVAPVQLPKAGARLTIVFSIIAIVIVSIIFYKKYCNYKDVL